MVNNSCRCRLFVGITLIFDGKTGALKYGRLDLPFRFGMPLNSGFWGKVWYGSWFPGWIAFETSSKLQKLPWLDNLWFDGLWFVQMVDLINYQKLSPSLATESFWTFCNRIFLSQRTSVVWCPVSCNICQPASNKPTRSNKHANQPNPTQTRPNKQKITTSTIPPILSPAPHGRCVQQHL